MTVPGRGWTDERVAFLKQCLSDGMSASQCARALGGVTRNGVIGKVSRLELQFKRSNGKEKPAKREPVKAVIKADAPAKRPERKRTTPKPPMPEKVELPEVPFEAFAKTAPKGIPGAVAALRGIPRVTAAQCRFPFGMPEDADFHFCQREAVAGRSYCAAHMETAYRPQTDERRRA